MPYLVLMDGPLKGQHIQLATGVNRIGRVVGNDVVLDNPSVSSGHAELTVGDGGCLLRDTESTNGTRVNGTQVTDVQLFRDDTIFFGDLPVLFAGDDAPARPPEAVPPPDVAARGPRPTVKVASVADGPRTAAVCPPDFRKRRDTRIVWIVVVVVLLLMIAVAAHHFIRNVL